MTASTTPVDGLFYGTRSCDCRFLNRSNYERVAAWMTLTRGEMRAMSSSSSMTDRETGVAAVMRMELWVAVRDSATDRQTVNGRSTASSRSACHRDQVPCRLSYQTTSYIQMTHDSQRNVQSLTTSSKFQRNGEDRLLTSNLRTWNQHAALRALTACISVALGAAAPLSIHMAQSMFCNYVNCEHMTSSTKPEVHKIWHFRQIEWCLDMWFSRYASRYT